MSSSSTHSRKAIFDFAKLAGSQNFFIWQARMTDVLIRENLWDVVSGEKVRLADPDFLDTETRTGRATVDIIDDDADDGQTAESSSAAATRSRPTRSTATRPRFSAAMSGAADKDKNKEGEAATSRVVEFGPRLKHVGRCGFGADSCPPRAQFLLLMPFFRSNHSMSCRILYAFPPPE